MNGMAFGFASTSAPQPQGTSAPSFKSHQELDRKSTRLNSSHSQISYAVFCLKKNDQVLDLKNEVPQPLGVGVRRHASPRHAAQRLPELLCCVPRCLDLLHVIVLELDFLRRI